MTRNKTKPVAPGSTLTIRLPESIDNRVLDYINQEREVKRNKHLWSLLCEKINEEMAFSGNQVVLDLPRRLSDQQLSEFKSHLNSLVNILLLNADESKNDSVDNKIDRDFYSGLFQDDED